MLCHVNTLAPVGSTTGIMSLLLLCAMPPAALVSRAPANPCMLSLTAPMIRRERPKGHIHYPFPWAGPPPVDTVATHLGTATNISQHKSHNFQGAAATAARQRMVSAFQAYRVQGLSLFAFAVNSHGFLDRNALGLFRQLCVAAASTGQVSFGSFLVSVHRELSVDLVKF
jgi:hypothetical protein